MSATIAYDGPKINFCQVWQGRFAAFPLLSCVWSVRMKHRSITKILSPKNNLKTKKDGDRSFYWKAMDTAFLDLPRIIIIRPLENQAAKKTSTIGPQEVLFITTTQQLMYQQLMETGFLVVSRPPYTPDLAL